MPVGDPFTAGGLPFADERTAEAWLEERGWICAGTDALTGRRLFRDPERPAWLYPAGVAVGLCLRRGTYGTTFTRTDLEVALRRASRPRGEE